VLAGQIAEPEGLGIFLGVSDHAFTISRDTQHKFFVKKSSAPTWVAWFTSRVKDHLKVSVIIVRTYNTGHLCKCSQASLVW